VFLIQLAHTLRGVGFLGRRTLRRTNINQSNIMSKTYICTATIRVTVQADDEFDAPYEAMAQVDVGDIEWDVEEGSSEESSSSQSLTNVTTKA